MLPHLARIASSGTELWGRFLVPEMAGMYCPSSLKEFGGVGSADEMEKTRENP
jgi:hypothetical protein